MARRGPKSRLNSDIALGRRLVELLADAHEFEVAVAYAKRSGAELIRDAGLPVRSRFVIGTGFALTDPLAVETLAEAGADVRLVIGSEQFSPNEFHPKIYLVRRGDLLVVISGSANLSRGGLESNVEQYEEWTMPLSSSEAHEQSSRFDALWRLGTPLRSLKDGGGWEDYRSLAEQRREHDRADRKLERRVAARIREKLTPPELERAERMYRARFEEGLEWGEMRERFGVNWRSTHFLAAMVPYIDHAGLHGEQPDLAPIRGDAAAVGRQVRAARERGQGWTPLSARVGLPESEVKQIYLNAGGKTLARRRHDIRYRVD